MNKHRLCALGIGLAWVCVVLPGCATEKNGPKATESAKVESPESLEWHGEPKTAPAELRPTLDRIALQEGGESSGWSGPYTLKEFESRLPAGLKSDDYHKWVSSYYRPEELQYYVIAKTMPCSFREGRKIVDTLGQFPVCVFTVSVMQDGTYYRRYVFNATGADRKVQ